MTSDVNRINGKYWNQWKSTYKFHAKTPGSSFPRPEHVEPQDFVRVTLDGSAYWGFLSEDARDAFVQTYAQHNAEPVI